MSRDDFELAKHRKLYAIIAAFGMANWLFHLTGKSVLPHALISKFSFLPMWDEAAFLNSLSQHDRFADAYIEFMAVIFLYFCLSGFVIFLLLLRRLVVFLRLNRNLELERGLATFYVIILFLAFAYLGPMNSQIVTSDNIKLSATPFPFLSFAFAAMWAWILVSSLILLLEARILNQTYKYLGI